MADLVPPASSARIDLANERDFDIGIVKIKPAELAVVTNGEHRELQPRVMQVLVALAHARPNVVSRDKLIEQCWDGRIVGDDALNRCILALRHLAQEFTPAPFEIETVARVGHRLIENGAKQRSASPLGRFKQWRLTAAALAFLLVATAGVLFWQQRGIASEPASIAVLPFHNLASGEPYFAEGVGEEIMGQLAREPAFRVAGSASAAQFSGPADPRKVGRALNVDYVLEGSVRPQADRVRINASLIRTSDGRRLWSETYDRKLDDILEVQTAIGQAVASGLRRKLVLATRKMRPINGEAYALYLNARGILRSGIPTGGDEALRLLRRAIELDPNFAPAWASLADAFELNARTNGNEGMIAIMPEALAATRRALDLDPNLAEAHGAYADLVGADSLEGIAHLQRAARISPGSAEGMMWRGSALHASGKFPQAYAAFRRAHDLDPLWSGPIRTIVQNYALAGNRPAAETAIKRGFPDDVMMQNFALARVAWYLGDFSEAARRLSAAPEGSRWASSSKLGLQNVLFMLKLTGERPSRLPLPIIGQGRDTPVRLWIDAPPSAAEWRHHNRSSAAELVYRDENVIGAKLMLRAGRERELVATYDSPTGLLGVRRGERVGTCYLANAAVAALALRSVGRGNEANEILRQADSAIRAAYGNGIVPLWFDDDAAGIWALQGKRNQAVEALDRALRRGSVHATRTDLLRLEDEPVFRSLRGDPRFEKVRSAYESHFARERRETERALKVPAQAQG